MSTDPIIVSAPGVVWIIKATVSRGLSSLVHAGNWTGQQPTDEGSSVDSVRPAWCEVLHELHRLVGSPGLRTVQHHAAANEPAFALSKSTVGTLLDGTTNPREASVEAFVNACLRYARTRRKQLPSGCEQPGYWIQRYQASRAVTRKTSGSWPIPPRDAGYRFEPFGFSAPRSASYQRAPSYLLDSRSEVVPFRDRSERQVLENWLDDTAPRESVLLVHGEGGQGKTRLAMQVARRAAERGWHVAQAFERPGPAVRRGERTGSEKLLIVVDYAERWAVDVLERMVLDLAGDADVQYLRVLLLARLDYGLWDLVTSTLDRQVDHLAVPVNLGRFTTGAPELATAFSAAVSAYQSAMQLESVQLPAPRMRKDVNSSPLGLHMAALAAVWAHENGQTTPSDADLSEFLLTHERKYWSANVAADLPAVAAATQVGQISRAVLVATLFGSLANPADARRLLRAAHLADSDSNAQTLIDKHAQLYPAGPTGTSSGRTAKSHLRPLHPDRFAEDFVAACARRPEDYAFVLDLVREVRSNGPGNLHERALVILAAAAVRHPVVNELLDELQAGVDTYVHVNSLGVPYYLHRTTVVLRGGPPQTVYFFANVRAISRAEPTGLPEDRVVKENMRNGFLTISKKKDERPDRTGTSAVV
ncbi:hypothetical protein ABH920_004174 [Catenulispora sp. EB89]|uniref:ATP-binding protein n=1 Tax=Catenulispora sp. EB89 TaxID=3156257 RepID=UPI003518A309